MWHLVVPGNGFFKSLESENVHDWGEQLGLDAWGIWGDLDQGWEDVVATVEVDCFTTAKDLATLLLDGLDAVKVVLNSSLGMKWTKQSLAIKRTSHLLWDLLEGIQESWHELVINFVVKEESSKTCASLTSSSGSSKDCSLECDFKVGIWHNNVGVISSKFEDGLTES